MIKKSSHMTARAVAATKEGMIARHASSDSAVQQCVVQAAPTAGLHHHSSSSTSTTTYRSCIAGLQHVVDLTGCGRAAGVGDPAGDQGGRGLGDRRAWGACT